MRVEYARGWLGLFFDIGGAIIAYSYLANGGYAHVASAVIVLVIALIWGKRSD